MILSPLKRIGGKATLVDWILDHLPPHRNYVETCAASAAVLFAKARGAGLEVYNDRDALWTTTMRVIRDHTDELAWKLSLTPFGRHEFERARNALDAWRRKKLELDELELVRLHFVTSRQSFAACGGSWSTPTEGARPKLWARLSEELHRFAARLQGVVLESRDYQYILKQYDSEDTTFYIDPPYLNVERAYYETNRQDGFDHQALRECVEHVRGSVVISYYASPFVDQLYEGWTRVSRKVTVDAGSKKRRETELLLIKEGEYAKQHRRVRLERLDIFADYPVPQAG